MLRPVKQPDQYSCGPASVAMALRVLGLPKRSMRSLIHACATNSNGTSTKHLLQAIARTLQLPVLTVRKADLRHIKACLRATDTTRLAVIVPYLYDTDQRGQPITDSGHWAVISGYSSKNHRLTVYDSYTGKRKSYVWSDFLRRWRDYDLSRIRGSASDEKKYRFIKRWHTRMLIIVAREPDGLPAFRSKRVRII